MSNKKESKNLMQKFIDENFKRQVNMDFVLLVILTLNNF